MFGFISNNISTLCNIILKLLPKFEVGVLSLRCVAGTDLLSALNALHCTFKVEPMDEIRAERARKDVYGRRIGSLSATGRMLYKPPPNFTIQQFRKYKKRKLKRQFLRSAGVDRTQNKVEHLLLQSDNIQAFNRATRMVTPNIMDKSRRRRPAYEKPVRSHTQDCGELRTVTEKFRDDYYFKPTGEKIRTAHFPEATSWFKGQWVECLHKKRWHPGQIAQINLSLVGNDPHGHITFDIRYPWGSGLDCNVPERNIRWMPPTRHWYEGEPVVVNWLGRGNWFTASIAKVHCDGSNSVDILFDDGRTVGCVHGPRYETRVPLEMIQQVRWYVGQPVLAQYRGRGLWYRAHVIRVDQTPKKHTRLSTLVLMGADDGDDKDQEDDERCTVMVQYDGLGGGEATEQGVTRQYLRPWLGDFMSNLSMPVSQSDNFGSSIESVFVPSAAEPNSVDLAWFWGGLRIQNSSSENQRGSRTLFKESSESSILHRKHPLPSRKFGADGAVAPLRAPLLDATFEQYSLDGHLRIGKKETLEQKRKRLNMLRTEQLRRIKSKSNAAISAAASPDQLVTLTRSGPGLEQVTIRMSHKDLGSAGLLLTKFVTSIEGVNYRSVSGTPIVKFYVTVRPGSYNELSSTLLSISGGTASIAVATQQERIVHFKAPPTITLEDVSKLPVDMSSSSVMSTTRSHTDIVTFLNLCRRGETKRVQKWMEKKMVPSIVTGLSNIKTGMNPLLAAALGCHVETAKVLLEVGCDPTNRDLSGRCALKLAQQNEFNSKNKDSDDAQRWQELAGLLANISVYKASMIGNLSRLRYLETKTKTRERKRGKWLVRQNAYGMTPLHLAIMHGHLKVARWIDKRVGKTAWRVMNRVGQTPADLCVSAPKCSTELIVLADQRR